MLIVQVEIRISDRTKALPDTKITLTTGEVLSAQEGDSFLDVQNKKITSYMFEDGIKNG